MGCFFATMRQVNEESEFLRGTMKSLWDGTRVGATTPDVRMNAIKNRYKFG